LLASARPIDLGAEPASSQGEKLAGVVGAENRGNWRRSAPRWRVPRACDAMLKASDEAGGSRASPRIHDARVAPRRRIGDGCVPQQTSLAERAGVQHDAFNLPGVPTTTIGSSRRRRGQERPRAHAKGALTMRYSCF